MYESLIHQLSRAAGVQNSPVQLTVTSLSMAPMLKTGTKVLVQTNSPKNYACGDMIVWERGSAWYTHRVVKTSAAAWITKGDALWECDPPVEADQVLGCVTQVVDGSRSWDMRHPPWPGLNTWLGRLSAWEAALFGAAARLGSRRLGVLLALPLRTTRQLVILAAQKMIITKEAV